MSCMCLLVLRKPEGKTEETADCILTESGFSFFRGERMSWIPAFVQKQVDEHTFVLSIADGDQYDNCEEFVQVPHTNGYMPDYDAYEKRDAIFARMVRELLNAGFS